MVKLERKEEAVENWEEGNEKVRGNRANGDAGVGLGGCRSKREKIKKEKLKGRDEKYEGWRKTEL